MEEDNIRVLIDTDDSYPHSTGVDIRRALKTLVGGARAGDIIFFTTVATALTCWSKHGTKRILDMMNAWFPVTGTLSLQVHIKLSINENCIVYLILGSESHQS